MWELGLDPMRLSHVKLLAFDLHALQNPSSWGGPDTFWRKGRPVRNVEMMGVVVSRERKDKFLKFEVDDGTACVPCILWLNHLTSRYYSRVQKPHLDCVAAMALEQDEEVQLGRLVRLQGRVAVYNKQLQLTVKSVLVERNPNAEIHHWMDCIYLAVHCYDLPASIPPKNNAL
ncbi:CST complex subunit STN1 isoform X3 [Cryptomeria japonica]|uniref:CST complex subunit STN1 isoform X3 n=1 Tax=Cryptomeria japonica TaxID=3369 RepID=UPI0025AD0184|nr:CST complex subunit STN1 isoform X3 [Cryptomeria japonica]